MKQIFLILIILLISCKTTIHQDLSVEEDDFSKCGIRTYTQNFLKPDYNYFRTVTVDCYKIGDEKNNEFIRAKKWMMRQKCMECCNDNIN